MKNATSTYFYPVHTIIPYFIFRYEVEKRHAIFYWIADFSDGSLQSLTSLHLNLTVFYSNGKRKREEESDVTSEMNNAAQGISELERERDQHYNQKEKARRDTDQTRTELE